MKKIITLIISLILTCSYSQIGIIKDKDGFTNVRKSTEKNSEIVYKLKENEAFWYHDYGEEWIEVFIPQDKFCIDASEDLYLGGYIHKSRLLPIGNIEKVDQKEIQFSYEFSDFLRVNHIDNGNGKSVSKIDGRKFWGTDGGYPKKEITKVNVIINNQRIDIHKVFYNDLYECYGQIKIHKNKDLYFIYQMNSDGAGTYELLWVLTEKHGLTQRLVGTFN